jgi:hypothetical protein
MVATEHVRPQAEGTCLACLSCRRNKEDLRELMCLQDLCEGKTPYIREKSYKYHLHIYGKKGRNCHGVGGWSSM